MNNYYKDTYCERNQGDVFAHKPFRRFDYYTVFTEAQYESLVALHRYLAFYYSIEHNFLDEHERYETFNNIVGKGGIVTHVNYRRSGKEDIGPAFDCERVISGVQLQSR